MINDGKKGAAAYIYDYPDSFVLFVLQLLGYMKESLFPSSFRQAEGVVKAHAVNKLPSIPQQYNKQKSKQTGYQNQ